MEPNQLQQTIIREAVESYKKVMSTLLKDNGPYSPEILGTINLKMCEDYTRAIRDTLKANDYDEALISQELTTAFETFKEMNEFQIEELHQKANQIVRKLKMKYSGNMEELLDLNPDGLEEQALKKAHEDTVRELNILLETELQSKIRASEPIEPHRECLRFHSEKYFRSIEDANQENLENATTSNKKIFVAEKKADHIKHEAQSFADKVFVDTNVPSRSVSTSFGVSKNSVSLSCSKDAHLEYVTNLKMKEVVIEEKINKIKPIRKHEVQPVVERFSDVTKVHGPSKSCSFGDSKQLTLLPYKSNENLQFSSTQGVKQSMSNKAYDKKSQWGNYSSDSHFSKTPTPSKTSKSKSMKTKRPNQYENVSVMFNAASESNPITFTQQVSPPAIPRHHPQAQHFQSTSTNIPTRTNTTYNSQQQTFNSQKFTAEASIPPSPSLTSTQALLPPLLISLTPHEVTIGIRLQEKFSTLENEFGKTSTSMEVAYTKSATFLYGSAASLENFPKNFWSLEECFMWGKTPWSTSVTINGKLRHLRGEMLVGYVLKRLKISAERQLGGGCCWEALIAVPNWFESVDRNLVEDAARAAGFTSIKLVNQLSALALRHIEHVKRKGVGSPSNFLILQKYKNFIYAAAFGADTTLERVHLLGHCLKKYETKQTQLEQRFLSWNARIRDKHEKEATKLIRLVHNYALQIGHNLNPEVMNDLADRSWYLHPTFLVSDSERWIGLMQDAVKAETVTKDVNDVMTGLAYLAPRLATTSIQSIIDDKKCLITSAAHLKNNFPRMQVDEIAHVINEMENSGVIA